MASPWIVYIVLTIHAYIAAAVATLIVGQTDFLYGFGTATTQSSTLLLPNCDGGITAWKGTNTATFANKYGIYMMDSRSGPPTRRSRPRSRGNAPSAVRGWNSLHRSIFARSFEDPSIRPAGHKDWVVDGVSRVGWGRLWGSLGDFAPGFDVPGKVDGGLSTLLDWETFEGCSSPQVFQTPDGIFGHVGWIDWEMAGSEGWYSAMDL